MKKIIFVFFFIFFWLQYSFWFGKNGVCDFFRIKNNIEIKKLNMIRTNLKLYNSQLINEIDDLINNEEEAIEERARSELNMIKSDEIFYNLVSIDKRNIYRKHS